MSTHELVELRCPKGPQQLLAKMLRDPEVSYVPDGNLMELSCRDCTRVLRRGDSSVLRVVHRYNLLGELVESAVQRR